MSIARHRGICLHCGHDHDADQAMFAAAMKARALVPEAPMPKEVLLCCASGEGTHQFHVAADEAGVMKFLEEMTGEEEGGGMVHSLAHYRDPDNWSNGGTAYNVQLYCAEFSVWKIAPDELAFTPSPPRLSEGPWCKVCKGDAAVCHRTHHTVCEATKRDEPQNGGLK